MPLLSDRPLRGILNLILYAVVTAVVTLALATVMSGASKNLADRVDENAAVARAGVDTVMCVLLVDPSFRDQETLQACADAHGYPYTPTP